MKTKTINQICKNLKQFINKIEQAGKYVEKDSFTRSETIEIMSNCINIHKSLTVFETKLLQKTCL